MISRTSLIAQFTPFQECPGNRPFPLEVAQRHGGERPPRLRGAHQERIFRTSTRYPRRRGHYYCSCYRQTLY